MRVVGLDLSLTGTGVAAITWDFVDARDAVRVETWRLSSDPAGELIEDRAVRLTFLASQIVSTTLEADLVAVERMAYSSNTGSVTDRAGLWWLVCARLARREGVPVADVVNNHLKMYAVGAGGGKGAGKDRVLAETVRRYGHLVEVNSNDEADALQLAALCYHRLTGRPLVELPLTHHRALQAIKWPTDLPTGA